MSIHDLLVTQVKNPSKFNDRLYLGGMATSRNVAGLRSLGITAVMNLTDEELGHDKVGFKSHTLFIQDGEPCTTKKVAEFIEVMKKWKASDESVLIHCHAGISRTSAMTIAWLMYEHLWEIEGFSTEPWKAEEVDLRELWSFYEGQVKLVRPIIMPHQALKDSVMKYFKEQYA